MKKASSIPALEIEEEEGFDCFIGTRAVASPKTAFIRIVFVASRNKAQFFNYFE
jgi:hypothetical protein